MNLIECTIKMKEEALAHYERLSEAVADKDLKRIFSLLASAEDEHIQTLIKLKANMKPAGAENITFSENACVFRPLLDSANLDKVLMKDSDAFNHVVAEEEEAIGFYEQLAHQSKDEIMKKLCRKLADQERKHLDKITNIYAFVEDPRTYLEWREFSNLKTL